MYADSAFFCSLLLIGLRPARTVNYQTGSVYYPFCAQAYSQNGAQPHKPWVKLYAFLARRDTSKKRTSAPFGFKVLLSEIKSKSNGTCP